MRDKRPTMEAQASVAGSHSGWCGGQRLSSQLSREANVKGKRGKRRALLDAKLAELASFAKQLCPGASVEASTLRYEDEDGTVHVFPPPGLSEAEEDRIELAIAARAGEIFDDTGLFILCAVLDPATR